MVAIFPPSQSTRKCDMGKIVGDMGNLKSDMGILKADIIRFEVKVDLLTR